MLAAHINVQNVSFENPLQYVVCPECCGEIVKRQNDVVKFLSQSKDGETHQKVKEIDIAWCTCCGWEQYRSL